MGSIEDSAMRITQAFEDDFFDKERKEIYTVIFDRYLSVIEMDSPDPYEAMISLARHSPAEFDAMVNAFREKGVLP